MSKESFEEEVIAAVNGNCSGNRLTKDDEDDYDKFLLGQDIEKTEEEVNSHFSKNNRHTKPYGKSVLGSNRVYPCLVDPSKDGVVKDKSAGNNKSLNRITKNEGADD